MSAHSPPEPGDPFQLRAALDGDGQAWEDIVDEFLPTIWQWARSCGLSRDDAEDVCQNVWYKLKDRGHTIEDPSRLAGWLATTTRREAIALKQKLDQTRSLVLDHIATATDSTVPGRASVRPDDVVLLGDLHRRLAVAFEALSHPCRELLALCWNDSLGYQEIAAQLRKPVGYIGPTRQRCLAKLRTLAALNE